jgi:hypothetical protein
MKAAWSLSREQQGREGEQQYPYAAPAFTQTSAQ